MDPNNTSSNGADLARQLAKTAKNLGKKVAKAVWKVIKAIFKALSKHWIGWIIIAVIVIIVLVLAYFAMPGMMRDKFDSLFNVDIAKYFQNGAVSALDEDYQDIVDVANYIESMGYSLIGDGFVTPTIKEADNSAIMSFEDVVDGYPNYVYKVGDDYRYHFYDGESIVPIKYYNEYGKEVDNTEGDYLTIGDFTSMFGYTYYDGYIIDGDNNVLHVQYQDKYGNVIDNWTNQTISGSTYMDEFGIIRKTPSGSSEEGQTTGELALFKEYYSNDDDIKDHARHYNLIRSYLLSDYRIYILKNDDEGILKALGDIFRKAFGGNQDAWSKGLIKLYLSEGGYSKDGAFAMHLGGGGSIYSELTGLFDGVSMTKDTLSISKGLGNNKMQFSIVGWAPRYGMSLDFLLALHLGTNAPDLTYAMLQNFDTEVQVYLDAFTGSVDSVWVDPNPNKENKNFTPDNGDTIGSYNYIAAAWGWPSWYITDPDSWTGLVEDVIEAVLDRKLVQLFLWHGDLSVSSPSTCEHYLKGERKCSEVPPHNDYEGGDENYICDTCYNYFKKVFRALAAIGDKDYASYQPYIARVVGSWFRDTYFIIPDSEDKAIKTYAYKNKENANDGYLHPEVNMNNTWGQNAVLVEVDKEYLGDTGQYWSKYETNEDGSYKLYFLKADGTTSGTTMEDFLATGIVDGVQMTLNGQPVTGYASKEDAESDGWAFVKKVETSTLQEFISDPEHNVGKDSSYSGFLSSKVLWTAYAFKKGSSEDDWIKVKHGDNTRVDALYDVAYNGDENAMEEESTGIFYKLKRNKVIEQVEDAQRGETNTLVKYLFKYRQYYIYDGATDRAMQIGHDKIRVLNGYSDYTKYDADPTPDDEDVRGRYYLNKKVADEYSIRDAMQANSSITVDNFYTSWKGLISEDGTRGLLIDYYGSDWISEVKTLLYKYGRSALRQSYDWYTFDASLDKNMLAEQWLDWQLDMYYMDKFGVDLNKYYGGEKDSKVPSSSELLKLKYDPRDPDLISTIQITKNSLNAFSILESTGSLDADYAYRDLKELVVELNYFDKEDISEKNAKVFTWVMPQLEPAGWPVRPWDKQDVEYGTLIESNETYKALTGNTSASAPATEPTIEEPEEPEEEEENLGELVEKLYTLDTYIGSTRSDEEGRNDWMAAYFFDYYIHGTVTKAEIADYLKTKYAEYRSSYENGFDEWEWEEEFLTAVPTWFFEAYEKYVTNGGGQSEEQNENPWEDKLKDVYNLEKAEITHSGTPSTYEEYRRLYALESEEITEQDVRSAANTMFLHYYDANKVESLPDWVYELLDEDNKEKWREFRPEPTEEEEEEEEQQQATGTSSAMYFNGYTDGQLIASPVTGKILEIGRHERINVYTGEPENVEYIIIQVMDGGTGNGSRGKTRSNYFENRMDSGNSFGYSQSTSYNVEEALDLFYNEYSSVCDGYTIMIDGLDVDLAAEDSDSGSDGVPTAEQIALAFEKQETYTVKTKDGKYTTNKVYGLYNSSERAAREEKEQAKADAPFYIRYGVSAEYPTSSGSSNGVYYKASESDPFVGYYVKEGKYIGKTIATKEATGTVEQNKITYTLADFAGVPAEYMRIQMNDTDHAVVENVEDYFNIPKILNRASSSGLSANAGTYAEILETDDDAITFIAGVCCAAVTNVYREDSAEEFEQAIAATAWALRNRYEKCVVEKVCSPWYFNTSQNINYKIHNKEEIQPVWYAISPDMHTHVTSKSEVKNVTGNAPVSYTVGNKTYWANGPWEEAIAVVKAVYDGAYEPIVKDCDSWKSNGTRSLSAFYGAHSMDDVILIPAHGNRYFCYGGIHLSAYQ